MLRFRLRRPTLPVAKLRLAKTDYVPRTGFTFRLIKSHRRYLFRADLCVVQMIPSVLNSPDLIKAKNKPFHSATSASNQYLMPIFSPSLLQLKQIGCWMPDTAWQVAQWNIWLLDTTQLIIWHSVGEFGRPAALTQTWILRTQIKLSPSSRQVLWNSCCCLKCGWFFPHCSETKGSNLVRERSRVATMRRHVAVKTRCCTAQQSCQRRLMSRCRTRHISGHHPELSLFQCADNWHKGSTMNKPFLPILHNFTLSLMLFVLVLSRARGIGSLRGALLISWWKVWLQLSAPSVLPSNEAVHKRTHLHQSSPWWSRREAMIGFYEGSWYVFFSALSVPSKILVLRDITHFLSATSN